MAKRAKRRSVADLTEVPAAALQYELNRRRKSSASLLRKRAKFMEKVAAIDAELAKMPPMTGGGRRPRNEQNLIESLAAVVKGKTMGVSEAADAVRAAGYQSASPNFRQMVNVALSNKKHFKRVERGMYTTV